MDKSTINGQKRTAWRRSFVADVIFGVSAVFSVFSLAPQYAHAQMVGADRQSFLQEYSRECFKAQKQIAKAQNRDVSDSLVTAWCRCNAEYIARTSTYGEMARAEQAASRGDRRLADATNNKASSYCQSQGGNWLRLVP